MCFSFWCCHSNRILTGDPRRPYPQDVEMKRGLLGKLSMKSNSVKTLSDLASQMVAESSNQNPEQSNPQTFGMLNK